MEVLHLAWIDCGHDHARKYQHSGLHCFSKNNTGRDTMIDAPSNIDEKQLTELSIQLKLESQK